MYRTLRRRLKQTLLDTVAAFPEGTKNEIVKTIREHSDRDLRWFDYRFENACRWPETSPHPHIKAKLDRSLDRYFENLRGLAAFTDSLLAIPLTSDSPTTPTWTHSWVSALDGIALHGFVAQRKPRHYFEVGSGSSTKFVRHAIDLHKLGTKLLSVDPKPRKEIDAICDEMRREPFERVPLTWFERAEANDVVFIDNSHVALMNTDVTAFFFDLLPRLPKGVLVGIHDIFWPYDYPDSWAERHYAEQYLLGMMLLGGEALRPELPAYYLSVAYLEKVAEVFQKLFAVFSPEVQRHGGAFWFTWQGLP